MALDLRQLFDSVSSTYTYLLFDTETKEAIIIDTVIEQFERDMGLINKLGLNLKYILETHIHADHITAAYKIKKALNAKIIASQNAKADCIDIHVSDGQKFNFGSYSIAALATPGHTNTCTSYYCEGMVFTGDTLLINGCGRTDFQEGSSEKLYESVRNKLFSLEDSTIVYPAHDYKGYTRSTIGEEKKFNARLSLDHTKEDFLEIMANLKLDLPKKIHEAVPANLNCGRVN